VLVLAGVAGAGKVDVVEVLVFGTGIGEGGGTLNLGIDHLYTPKQPPASTHSPLSARIGPLAGSARGSSRSTGTSTRCCQLGTLGLPAEDASLVWVAISRPLIP
jgi:hypothetical protein